MCVCVRERGGREGGKQRERQRQRQRQKDRERDRETERDRDGERERVLFSAFPIHSNGISSPVLFKHKVTCVCLLRSVNQNVSLLMM